MSVTHERQHDIMTRVIAKAWTDPKYKEALRVSPKEVLEKEGITLRKADKVCVFFNTETERNFVIPAPPLKIDISRDDILRLAAERMQVVTVRG